MDESENIIALKDFYVELLSAVKVCFEEEAERSGGAIILTAPNGQKFRIVAECI